MRTSAEYSQRPERDIFINRDCGTMILQSGTNGEKDP